jgi:hypothetical protein
MTGTPCPYGVPGDLLWVRETWAEADEWVTGYAKEDAEHVVYRADGAVYDHTGTVFDPGQRYWPDEPHATEASHWVKKWKPSIFLPKWAPRLFLRVESVRVERLNEITVGDALAEGIDSVPMQHPLDAIDKYAALWESINGSGSWDANPWVWVVTFSRIERPAGWPVSP